LNRVRRPHRCDSRLNPRDRVQTIAQVRPSHNGDTRRDNPNARVATRYLKENDQMKKYNRTKAAGAARPFDAQQDRNLVKRKPATAGRL